MVINRQGRTLPSIGLLITVVKCVGSREPYARSARFSNESCGLLSKRIARELKAKRIMNNSIKESIGDGFIANCIMPIDNG